jgi:tRNA pseudouridine55 synthase
MLLDKNSINKLDEWLNQISDFGGAALIDKPMDWTSFDVVAKLRNTFRVKKTGHAGTLDPLATGLLILCFGKATKTINDYVGLKKRYTGVIKLGATTKTLDSEAPEENITDISVVTDKDIIDAANKFTGEIEQLPPMFSAKRVKGKRLYKHARKDRVVERTPTCVTIYNISISQIDLPFVEIDVECSKGTYIRTLADDIGREIGVGGYLHSLRRTAIGDYRVEDALAIEEIIEQINRIRN